MLAYLQHVLFCFIILAVKQLSLLYQAWFIRRANVAPNQTFFNAAFARHRHGTLIYTLCQPNCTNKLYEPRYEYEAITLCLDLWRRKGNVLQFVCKIRGEGNMILLLKPRNEQRLLQIHSCRHFLRIPLLHHCYLPRLDLPLSSIPYLFPPTSKHVLEFLLFCPNFSKIVTIVITAWDHLFHKIHHFDTE